MCVGLSAGVQGVIRDVHDLEALGLPCNYHVCGIVFTCVQDVIRDVHDLEALGPPCSYVCGIVFTCVQGVIRDARDLEALGPDFREAYSKHPDDSALNDSRVIAK